MNSNLEKFQTHLVEELDFPFSFIRITETRIRNELGDWDFNPMISNYYFEYVPTPLSLRGVRMYIDQRFKVYSYSWFSFRWCDGHVGVQNNGKMSLMFCVIIESNSQKTSFPIVLYTNMAAP